MLTAVTGGTGNIGRHVLSELAQTDAPVRVLARDPSRLSDYQERFDVVAANLDVPATLAAALAGVERLFMLAPGPDVPAQDAALIRAAVAAEVRHVVMLSSLGVELGGIAGGGPHLPGEAMLQGSGLGWTLLHPSEFMSNTVWWRDTILAAGSIFVPSGAGRVGFVDPADIGAVAAKVLTTEGHHGQIYRLTGPQALSTAEIAAVLCEVLDRPVQHVDVPAEAFRTGLEQAGLPPSLIDMQAEYYAAVHEGVVDIVSTDVPSLLGRAANDYRTWARAHAGAFSAESTVAP